MRTRIALAALGVVSGLYGAWLLLSRESWDQIVSTGVWLAGGVVLHDFVLAPIVLILGAVAVRFLPVWSRAPIAFGVLILGTVTIAVLPMLGAWGRRDDNPTLLDRDYLTGWLILAAVVVAGVAAACVVVRSRMTGGHDGASAGGR